MSVTCCIFYGVIKLKAKHSHHSTHKQTHLREVVRVGHLGGHVKSEVFVIVDVGISQTDQRPATGYERLLQQDRLQNRVQSLFKLRTHTQTYDNSTHVSTHTFLLSLSYKCVHITDYNIENPAAAHNQIPQSDKRHN